MATLTGYKPVPRGKNQPQGGNQNPVFVLDEPNDSPATNGDSTQTAVGIPEQTAESPSIPANHAHASEHHVTAQPRLPAGGAKAVPPPTVPSGVPPVVISSSTPSPTPTATLQSQSPSPQQQLELQQMPAANARTAAHDDGGGKTPPEAPKHLNAPASRLGVNANNGSQTNLSVLSIDCYGTGNGNDGKSPRSPRRSPLMALFKGKPRESTRRTYTDEDQFEIEWADLSLQVSDKQSILKRLAACCPGSGSSHGGPSGPKTILNGVDGIIRSGEITAVLGPSGAGKTSLLNSLFGKYRTAITGSVKVTGAPSKKHLTVCTIPQSDYLISTLTTEESLWFASRLKNCEDDFNHDKNIERVIELLGLQRCRATRINKLSGGQYKRVSIAQEMLSSPDILVLDEPTSGLDSLTCYRTVKVLRDLVEASKAHNLVNPMSIVLTIHQPHREVLDLFHYVYVMAVGGYTLYHGTPADMEVAVNEHSGVVMPAEGYNPASFMVEIASEEYGKEAINKLVVHQRKKFASTTRHKYPSLAQFGDNHAKTDSNTKHHHHHQHQHHQHQHHNQSQNLNNKHLKETSLSAKSGSFVDVDLSGGESVTGKETNFYNVSKLYGSSATSLTKDIDSRIMTPRSGKNSDGVFWTHVWLMTKRCLLSSTRDPLLFTIRVGAHIFIPLVVALIYGPNIGIPNGCPFYKPEIDMLEYASQGVDEIQSKHDDIRIQFQNVGLHFMVYYAFGLCMLAFTAISFPLIMHVLIKEIRNGWYSLSTFVVGKFLAELPMALILPPISIGIIYYLTGQPSSAYHWRYCVQSLILVLIIMIAEAKGLVFGAVFMNSMQTSVFAASVSTVPFILLSGFLIRIDQVPYILQHFAHLSYFKHSVEALIITRYGFGMCACNASAIPPNGVPRIIGIPQQIMSLTDYYVNSYQESIQSEEEAKRVEAENLALAGNNRNKKKIKAAAKRLPRTVDEDEELSKPSAWVVSSGGGQRSRKRRFAAQDGASDVTEAPVDEETTTVKAKLITTTSASESTQPEATTTLTTTTTTTTAKAKSTSTTTTTTEAPTTTTTTTTTTTSSSQDEKSTTQRSRVGRRKDRKKQDDDDDDNDDRDKNNDENEERVVTSNNNNRRNNQQQARRKPKPSNADDEHDTRDDSDKDRNDENKNRDDENKDETNDDNNNNNNDDGKESSELTTTGAPADSGDPPRKSQGVFFDKLATLLTRANSFGYSITSCDDVAPFTIKDMGLRDSKLTWLIVQLVMFIFGMKVISYFVVDFCIKFKL